MFSQLNMLQGDRNGVSTMPTNILSKNLEDITETYEFMKNIKKSISKDSRIQILYQRVSEEAEKFNQLFEDKRFDNNELGSFSYISKILKQFRGSYQDLEEGLENLIQIGSFDMNDIPKNLEAKTSIEFKTGSGELHLADLSKDLKEEAKKMIDAGVIPEDFEKEELETKEGRKEAEVICFEMLEEYKFAVQENLNQNKDVIQAQSMSLEIMNNWESFEEYTLEMKSFMEELYTPRTIAHRITAMTTQEYSKLRKLHQQHGLHIVKNPLITNLTANLFDSVSNIEELLESNEKDNVSQYHKEKSKNLINEIAASPIYSLVKNPELINPLIFEEIQKLDEVYTELSEIMKEYFVDITKIEDIDSQIWTKKIDKELGLGSKKIREIEGINFMDIKYKDPKKVISKEQRKTTSKMEDAYKLISKEIQKISNQYFKTNKKEEFNFWGLKQKELKNTKRPLEHSESLVDLILDNRVNLEKITDEDNTYFVCTMSGADMFSDGPGQLTLLPEARPKVKMGEVFGFGEVENHYETIITMQKYPNLATITNPNQRPDKNHVLLIGPPGCGKSEFLRTIGNDPDSLGVYVTGSDLLTCWYGEAQKNPKRLFNSAVRLRKKTKKHVHILFDEFDFFAKEGGTGNIANEMALEFQTLLDGLSDYEGITLWACVNYPEKIPDPLLRRFAYREVVGELDNNGRAELLERFVEKGLPISEYIRKEDYIDLANKMNGAVGDMIRKVADNVWRETFTTYIENHPKSAQKLEDYLGKDRIDNESITDEQRDYIKKELGKEIKINKDHIEKAIDEFMKNPATQREIKKTQHFYSNAEQIVKGLYEPPTGMFA